MIPAALDHLDDIRRLLSGRRPAVFLDYDGTLTPIVARPELAVLSDEMRATLHDLAAVCPVAIVSGRDRQDVEGLVQIESLIYAGSHGFDITGPGGLKMRHEEGARYGPMLQAAADELQERVGDIVGVLIERKKYALALHYRLVAEEDLLAIGLAMTEVAAQYPELRRTGGKKVYELRPGIAWDKGKAVTWLLQALELNTPDVLPLYLGDDETDEDAFGALQGRGVGILVADQQIASRAQYLLRDCDEVRVFLRHLIAAVEATR